MIRRPPRSTPLYSSAASDVYKRQLPNRLRARISRRQRKPAHLRHRLSAQPEDSRRLAAAMTIQKYELANGGVNFHGKHPGQSPKGPALPLDGFYAARSANTAPLQWQSFSPPRTPKVLSVDKYGDWKTPSARGSSYEFAVPSFSRTRDGFISRTYARSSKI